MSTATIIFSIAKLLGGLGLFIYGMSIMSRALQETAGHKLRSLLYKLTKNRISGVGIGTILGFLIHSSATTVMMVGFINAGLMSLPQSIGVMIGANIGTTLSMQVISFKITKYCYFAIASGFFIYLVSKNIKIKNLGYILFGFGLLFLGMSTMSAAVGPLKNAGYFEAVIQNTNATSVAGMLLGLLISTAFTGIIQSSGATIGILFALSMAGVFTKFDQVFPFIIGAHIGTCATALLGCIGTQIAAKRSALSHLLFNVIGAVLAILMYKFYAWIVPMTSDDLVRQIANANTIKQCITALLFLPFTKQYAKLIEKITPSENEPEKSYLEVHLLETPEKAIVAAIKELRRMSCVARDMLTTTMHGLLEVKTDDYLYVKKNEEVLDALKKAVHSYLLSIAGRKLSRRQSIIIQYLMAAADDIERMGDHIEKLTQVTCDKMKMNIWFDDESMMDLIDLYKKLNNIMNMIVKSFEPAFYDSPEKHAKKILDERDEYMELSRKARKTYNKRILERKENALNGIFYTKYIVCFNKLVKHSKTIALVEREPLFFVKKHKLDKKSRKMSPNKKIVDPKIDYDETLFTDDDDRE